MKGDTRRYWVGPGLGGRVGGGITGLPTAGTNEARRGLSQCGGGADGRPSVGTGAVSVIVRKRLHIVKEVKQKPRGHG